MGIFDLKLLIIKFSGWKRILKDNSSFCRAPLVNTMNYIQNPSQSFDLYVNKKSVTSLCVALLLFSTQQFCFEQ